MANNVTYIEIVFLSIDELKLKNLLRFDFMKHAGQFKHITVINRRGFIRQAFKKPYHTLISRHSVSHQS